MTRQFVLRRGASWLCAPLPARHDGTTPWVQKLEWGTDRDRAWLAESIDVALNRQQIVQAVHGWSTRIEAA